MENTVDTGVKDKPIEDHLHIRGEYYLSRIEVMYEVGSPPHTWRIPEKEIQEEAADRITSTYVENTII